MITIIGGTYYERCFEPVYDEVYGSGLRACKTIRELDKEYEISYKTFANKEICQYLDVFAMTYGKMQCEPVLIDNSPLFYYEYPLAAPRIFPRLDTLDRNKNIINCEAENILMYGFIEGRAKVKANKVVYDPQSPVNPISFKEMGSEAKELAIVTNWNEAKVLSKKQEIADIKRYFFEIEQVSVLVLKMGAKGAVLALNTGEQFIIPVYKTEKVWSIGSGDVFAATFAYHWFNGISPLESAKKASYATAQYCNCGDYQFSSLKQEQCFAPLNIDTEPQGQIYLAGPFFTFSQRWIVDQIRRAFMDMGLNIFSPFHDVGYGHPSDVAVKDLEALNRSSLVFAVLDGLDSGTLFEAGYAVSKNIPVLCYVENASSQALTMLEGTNCLFESDLTTAVYKAYWKLGENG
jgi:nucleoside 2-deoxyribosyltransferase